jgi:hypothetical protein
VRLVQRCQRHELFQRAQHIVVDVYRGGEVQPAVHHAVADPHQAVPLEVRAQEGDQVIDGARMPQLHAAAPGLLFRHLPRSVLGGEAGIGVEPLDLAACLQLHLLPAQQEQRKLQARRAGIEHDDGIGHGRVLAPSLLHRHRQPLAPHLCHQ